VTRIALLGLVVSVACSVPIGEFTAVGVVAAPGAEEITPATVTAVGHSCRWWVAGVPLGLPHLEEAVAEALTPSRATLLRNAELRSVHPLYGLVGRHCYVIAGRPATDAAARMPSPNSKTR